MFWMFLSNNKFIAAVCAVLCVSLFWPTLSARPSRKIQTPTQEIQPTPAVYIIIHGTWSCGIEWANAGGDFFDALEKSAPAGSSILPYTWNGNNDYVSRQQAATGLVKLIKSYPPKTTINIIAHSHGANVGILASQTLAKDPNNHHRIVCFYALGVPVNVSSYAPAMQAIDTFYNFFSFEDFVQPVFGFFERIYPEHERIANIRLFIHGKEPGHSDLHDPLVGQLLPHLSNFMQAHTNDLRIPTILYLEKDKIPVFKVDTDRDRLLLRDKQIIRLLATSMAPQ
jgi:hypothetical protein